MRIGLLLLAGCSTAVAAPRSAPVVEIAGDLDGKRGHEKVTLYGDGTLAAGTSELKLTFDTPEGATTEVKLAIVSLGGKRRGVWMISPTEDIEDPPPRHRIFVYEKGALRQVFDETIGSKVQVSARGTVRYVESGWSACMRVIEDEPAATHARKRVITYKLDAAGTRMVKTVRPSNEVQDCSTLSACPFVYDVVADDDVRFVGEILRNVRSKALETTQTLALGAGAGRSTIRIVEQKLETTYLDAVYLDVDGVRIAPRACALVPSLPYCAADGHYHVMTLGDVLELEFDAPAGARELVATGYYIPTKRALD